MISLKIYLTWNILLYDNICNSYYFFLYIKKLVFNEKGILKILVYGPLFFLPLVIGILIYNVVQYNDKVYKNDIQRLKSEYLKEQQKISFNEIEKTIKYISNTKKEMTNQLRKNLKNRVDEAYTIASHIYDENKNIKSKKEIQKIIIDALSKIRFFEGRGYYFINTNLERVFYLMVNLI